MQVVWMYSGVLQRRVAQVSQRVLFSLVNCRICSEITGIQTHHHGSGMDRHVTECEKRSVSSSRKQVQFGSPFESSVNYSQSCST